MNRANFKKRIAIGSSNFEREYDLDAHTVNRNEIKKILKSKECFKPISRIN